MAVFCFVACRLLFTGMATDGPKREEIKLRIKERYNFYSSLDTIRVVTSRRMRCIGHIACTGQVRNACVNFLRKILRGI
jgi:hypothetical protein